MMDINPGLMLWTIISFLIFFLLLAKFAWKPILSALEAREKGIKDNIESARKAREEAEAALADYQKRLAEAQAEAQSLVTAARRDAERVREELLAKSKTEAEAQVERARRQIEQESQQALKALREEIADLAVAAASRVIGKALDPKDHARLVAEGLKESPN